MPAFLRGWEVRLADFFGIQKENENVVLLPRARPSRAEQVAACMLVPEGARRVPAALPTRPADHGMRSPSQGSFPPASLPGRPLQRQGFQAGTLIILSSIRAELWSPRSHTLTP